MVGSRSNVCTKYKVCGREISTLTLMFIIWIGLDARPKSKTNLQVKATIKVEQEIAHNSLLLGFYKSPIVQITKATSSQKQPRHFNKTPSPTGG